MNANYDKIVRSVVKIEAGNSAGSGFHFFDKNVIVTNAHVIKGALENGGKIYAKIGSEKYELICKKFKEDVINDFAILKTQEAFPEDREVLTIADNFDYAIGTEVIYAGFPHGIDDLIVQKATIAGYEQNNPNHFYLDASVNSGNSGGLIVKISDNSIIGIVTQRRFIRIRLDEIVKAVNYFRNLAIDQSKKVQIQIGGINYNVGLANQLAEVTNIFRDVVLSNANTGLGIGQKIGNCLMECKGIY